MAMQTEKQKENALLIRELEAFCHLHSPSDQDLRFRAAIEKTLYLNLADLERGQLVRVVEATCSIDFPHSIDRNFHDAVMDRLGRSHNFKAMREIQIPGKWGPQPRAKANEPADQKRK